MDWTKFNMQLLNIKRPGRCVLLTLDGRQAVESYWKSLTDNFGQKANNLKGFPLKEKKFVNNLNIHSF